jgi:hypothetical protein
MRLFVLCALLAAGCRTPTEVVLHLDDIGGTPTAVTVRLHRSTPFDADPQATPPFVMAALDGADLDLIVTPQGDHTALSLLHGAGTPYDLTIAVSAPGFAAAPAGDQDGTFADGVSRELDFTLTAAVPDGGASDLAPRGDGAKGG